MQVTVVLHNIRSVHNVGSVFRTADGAGVERLILAGYSPTPLDHHGKERQDLAKVALGAQHSVPWEQAKTVGAAIKKLKKEGYKIVAVELDPKATNLFTYKPKAKKLAVILGNEVKGIPKATLKNVDDIVEIPMKGVKESLNVSVAAGVVLFTLVK